MSTLSSADSFDVVLLCGGKGSRLIEATHDMQPKSLHPVGGKELIRYTLDVFNGANVRRFIFAVSHQSHLMAEWIRQQPYSVEMVISEQIREGIAGAVQDASHLIESGHFVLCNTDEIRLNFNFSKFLSQCVQKLDASDGAMATTESGNLYRHRVVYSDDDGRIIKTQLKQEAYKESPEQTGMVNTGFLLLPRSCVGDIDEQQGKDWSSIIDPLVNQRRLFAIPNTDVKYFNVGTTVELQEASDYIAALST